MEQNFNAGLALIGLSGTRPEPLICAFGTERVRVEQKQRTR